jgi:hypothetical protein
MDIKVGKQAIQDATDKLKNWGRWGKDDQIGTLNHVMPEDIVRAAGLIRTGKVFALGIPLDRDGPQTGLFGGRFNPIHQMLATGTDAIAGQQDWNKIRYADDTLMLCVQGDPWDALGHIFYEDKAYNGTPSSSMPRVSTCSASSIKSRMVGRGVLLDARFRGVPWLKDGEGISNDELDTCAKERTWTSAAATSSSCAPGRWAPPAREDMGRLCGRRRARRQIRELLLVPGQADRGDLPDTRASRCGRTDHGSKPALALGGDPGDGAVHGRNLLSQGARRRLRRRRHLRVLLLRPATRHHRRHRLADQPAGNQVGVPSPVAEEGPGVSPQPGARVQISIRSSRRLL